MLPHAEQRLHGWTARTAAPATTRGGTGRPGKGLFQAGYKKGVAQQAHTSQRDTSGDLRKSESDQAILQEVLKRIEGSDGGSNLAEADQAQVNDLVDELEVRGQHQPLRPLDSPDIFGNFNVAYSSTQRASQQDGQPAGGRFRSRLGRKVFQTSKLCQSILQPDIVTNKAGATHFCKLDSFQVEFKLLGFVRGSVGLRGRLQPVGDDKATVKVYFEPPRLALGKSINLPIGPKSSVVLTTTYLTSAVRLGKGSRGSRFVFTKGGLADGAEMERVGLEKTTAGGWLWIGMALSALCAVAIRLWGVGLPGKLTATLPALLALLIGRAAAADVVSGGSAA